MGVGPLYVIFPKLFRIMANKESSVNECFEVGGGS